MSCYHGYLCRNCHISMYSDNVGNCWECGKPFVENHVEAHIISLLCICVFLFFILLLVVK